MPKITKHPKLRALKRTAVSGKVTVYYVFDMRGTGKKDVPLGKDWNVALVKWAELYHNKPRVKGTIEEAFALFEEKKLPEYTGETHRMYVKAIRLLRPVFGGASWEVVKLPHLITYMEEREGKIQANREISAFQVIWNYARKMGLTEVHWPAAGMKSAGWKNKEKVREVEVTDAMFSAIYAEADQLLRDAMDLASATGMRVTDVRTVPLPSGDVLRLKSSKKGKKSDFIISESPVLIDLLARRKANKKAEHLMFLAGPFKPPVTYWRLNERYTKARDAAAKKAREAKNEELAQAIESMFLRDCRRIAANLATSMEAARQLLQHDKATTTRIYRSEVEKIKPVR
jgi:hypothetical protein